MAIQTTEAVVLSRKDFRETSILATFYTKGFGKIKGIVKGIRAERSKYGSAAELFTLNKIVFYEKSKSEFNNITQCDLIDGLFGIRKYLSAIAYAAYISELADLLTEPNEADEEIFELLRRSLKLLSEKEDPIKVTRIFEMRFLANLGFAPTFENCNNCGSDISQKAKFSFRYGGMLCERCLRLDANAQAITRGTVQTLSHIKNSTLDSLMKFKISKSIENELGTLVEKLVASHLEKPPKTKKFIREVRRLTK